MRIVHYIPNIDYTSGGTTTYIKTLAEEMGKLCDVHIVTHKSKHPVVIKNCRIHFISSSIWGRMKREWKNLLNTLRPNIVHINCCWLLQCALTQKWAQNSGYKVVLTPHGMLEPWIIKRNYWKKKLPALILYQKNAIQKADIIHATAISEKENLSKLGYNDKIKTISNGIDVNNIQLKDNWEKTKTILFLSRIHPKKGIELLIESILSKKEKIKGYQIIIAGEGDKNYIEKLKKRSHTCSEIKFIGGVYNEQKWELLRESDILILPSFSENFGLVIAEALACGTPTITTQGAPWKDLIEHHCGWWVKAEVNEISHAIDSYLSLNVNELKEMGMNGRKLVEDSYSIQKTSQEMIKLYQGLL